MYPSRRGFLAGAAGCFIAASPLHAQTSADGFQIVRARRLEAPLLGAGSLPTAIWSFDDVVIRAGQGEELKLRFINELDFEIWLHFFGVRGPSGLMTLNVPAGNPQGVECVFTPPDAGTFWLGPMADQSRLRDMGLYAMLVVGEAQPLDGIADLPLIFDDWKLTDQGEIVGGFGDIETMVGEGRLGNWFTVNGRYRPKLALIPGKYTRLRLLNAANVRSMALLFKGADPLLVSLDGQPIIPRPLASEALSLEPGQRADLLLGPGGDTTLALDLFEDTSEIAYLAGGKSGIPPELGENFALPPNPISSNVRLDVARSVPLVIEGGIKGGLKQALYKGQPMELRQLLEHGMGWAFNGVAGPGGPPVVEAKLGETIVFDVENRTAFDQPLHVHGHVWREADQSAPWRDTALIPAKKTLRLVMVADNPGPWGIQSLVAERADGGLLAGFTVT
jgi:FtsP/CotA-like multicopper oxidase with cupredoxin domain